MDKIDIHNHEAKLETQREKVRNDPNISPRNKELILEFEKYLMIKDLSVARILKYLVMLGMISKKFGKDFDKATEEDLKDFVLNEIQYGKCENPIKKGKEYSEWTKHAYKIFLKRFYQWIYKCPDGEYPPIIKWMKTTINHNKIRLPQASELVTEDDIKRLIAVCDKRRDKAIISMLAETGMRISELGGLRIKDICFDELGGFLNILGKMGARNVRIISCVPYLKDWLVLHRFRDDPEAPLWLKMYEKGIQKSGGDYTRTEEERQISKMLKPIPAKYPTFRSLLFRAFQRAGIEKKLNPHSFRHARASQMANHLTEHQMDEYFGWVIGSRMASHYVHMSAKSLDNALKKLNGIKVNEDEQTSKLKPKICPRCSMVNESERIFCKNDGCKSPLDLNTAIKLEDELKKKTEESDKNQKMMEFIMQIPEIKNAIINHLGLNKID